MGLSVSSTVLFLEAPLPYLLLRALPPLHLRLTESSCKGSTPGSLKWNSVDSHTDGLSLYPLPVMSDPLSLLARFTISRLQLILAASFGGGEGGGGEDWLPPAKSMWRPSKEAQPRPQVGAVDGNLAFPGASSDLNANAS